MGVLGMKRIAWCKRGKLLGLVTANVTELIESCFSPRCPSSLAQTYLITRSFYFQHIFVTEKSKALDARKEQKKRC